VRCMLQLRASKGFKKEFDKKGWRHGGYRLMISAAGKCVLAGECRSGRWGSWTNHTYIQEF
jgi:hypothetical protein